jgi:hypothetical protein
MFYLKSEREAQLAHAVASTIFKQQSTPSAASMRRKRPASAPATPPQQPEQEAQPDSVLTPLDVGSVVRATSTSSGSLTIRVACVTSRS